MITHSIPSISQAIEAAQLAPVSDQRYQAALQLVEAIDVSLDGTSGTDHGGCFSFGQWRSVDGKVLTDLGEVVQAIVDRRLALPFTCQICQRTFDSTQILLEPENAVCGDCLRYWEWDWASACAEETDEFDYIEIGEDCGIFEVFYVPALNLENPTAPENYIDRGFASGTPLNWQDDLTGQIRTAIMAYLDQTPTPEQLKITIAYLQHHIHAPCWIETSPFGEVDAEMVEAIKQLRERSLGLVSLNDVNQYIRAALAVALDPL